MPGRGKVMYFLVGVQNVNFKSSFNILAIELKLDKNIYEHKALVHIFPLEIGGIVGRNRSCFLRIRKPTASYKKIY
jgi:asparagine synthetase A